MAGLAVVTAASASTSSVVVGRLKLLLLSCSSLDDTGELFLDDPMQACQLAATTLGDLLNSRSAASRMKKLIRSDGGSFAMPSGKVQFFGWAQKSPCVDD